MAAAHAVKVCVLGAPAAGKTALCRTLAEQPSSSSSNSSHAPTAGLRIQVLSRQVGGEHVQVQLWDVAGDAQPLWPALAQDVDGVLLVLDPHQPQQERALEQCYLRFAQPHNLTVKQCGVVAVSMVNADAASASASPPGWQGLRGKLRKLQSAHVCLGGAGGPLQHSRQAALELLDRLLAGCVAHKKDKLEHALMASTS